MQKKPRVLSVMSLVAINVIAVDSLRAFPISAEYGLALIFYYLAGALFFMIPVAFTAAEMASAWPEAGGIYAWVRRAFGIRFGFFVAWLQWIYNIIWYPTILFFLSSTVLYVFYPQLATHKPVILAITFIAFWLATLVNLLGMRISDWVSRLGAVVGTLFPAGLLIILFIIWAWHHPSPHLYLHLSALLPSIDSMKQLAVLSGMLFGLVGIEMSAVHAQDVKNPKHDYPRALFISVIVILVTSILASLAIAWLIPPEQINFALALVRSFSIYLQGFHMGWLLPPVVLCILFGGLSGVSAWVIGPAKCMLCACEDSQLWRQLLRKNKYDAPWVMLLLQGGLFSVFCGLFLWFPGINQSYWLLSDMTAQLSVIFYGFLFATAVVLRVKYPAATRPYSVPGGKYGVYLCAVLGIATCLFVFICGMFPPAQMQFQSPLTFVLVLLTGVVVLCLLPLIATGKKNSMN